MDRETVRTLPTEFPGCSWAIWSERFPDDGCIEERPDHLEEFVVSNVDRLDGRVVMLSLDPSGVEPEGYRNFHSPAGTHYDDRLKRFVQDDGLTNLVGAYMTDIVPDVVDPDSQKVTPEDVDGASLRRRGEHYGISDLVEQLLGYLDSRGETTAESLPNWDEFKTLAEEYEVAV